VPKHHIPMTYHSYHKQNTQHARCQNLNICFKKFHMCICYVVFSSAGRANSITCQKLSVCIAVC